MNKIAKTVAGTAVAVALIVGALACGQGNRVASGTGGGAHAVATTAVPAAVVTTPAALPSPTPARQPVTISGSGNKSVTASLVSGGYTVTYQAKSGRDYTWLIVEVISADGSTQGAIVNDSAKAGTLEGSDVMHAENTATYLFKVANASSETWTVTFTPIG